MLVQNMQQWQVAKVLCVDNQDCGQHYVALGMRH